MDLLSGELEQDLRTIGLSYGILELIPGEVERILFNCKDSFTLTCAQGKLALWLYRGRESGLVLQDQLFRILGQAESRGFLLPRLLNDGRTYAPVNDIAWFYVTDWLDWRQISFSNQADLKALVKLIVGFRSVIASSTLLYKNELNGAVDLQAEFHTGLEYLKAFELLAKHRIRPTSCDKLFLEVLPELLGKARMAGEILAASDYDKLVSEISARNLILGEAKRRNLRVDSDGNAIWLRLAACRLGLPIMDLVYLMIKSGRFNHWSLEWYERVLNLYDHYFTVSKAELTIIVACLTFPWDFYNLVSSYYLNHTHSPIALILEKMERLILAELQRSKLLLELKKAII